MYRDELVAIKFAGRQVTVAAQPAIIDHMNRRFALMLGDADRNRVAHFEVRHDGGTFHLIQESAVIVAEENIENMVETLVHRIAECFIGAFSSLLWFHAAVVARHGRAFMLPARWGDGKSSLAVALATEGWTYLSDDLAPLEPASNTIIPYPRTPTVRSHYGRELPRERISQLPKTEIHSEDWSIATRAVPLHCVIFPEYQFQGGCSLVEFAPAEAVVKMLSHCLNFSDDGSATVSHLAGLMPGIEAYRLPFSDATAAASLLTNRFELPVSEATG